MFPTISTNEGPGLLRKPRDWFSNVGATTGQVRPCHRSCRRLWTHADRRLRGFQNQPRTPIQIPFGDHVDPTGETEGPALGIAGANRFLQADRRRWFPNISRKLDAR